MIHEYTIFRIIIVPLLVIGAIFILTILLTNKETNYKLFCNITDYTDYTTNDFFNYSSWKIVNNQIFLYCIGYCNSNDCYKFNNTNCNRNELKTCVII